MIESFVVSDETMYKAKAFALMRGVEGLPRGKRASNMSDVFLSERIDSYQMICVSELGFDAIDCDHMDCNPNSAGLFLYLLDERPVIGGIRVIAKLTSTDAAYDLFEIFARQFVPSARNQKCASFNTCTFDLPQRAEHIGVAP